MPIEPLNPYAPIIGDDDGYVNIPYRRVPQGFRIPDLTPAEDCPLTADVWTRLTTFADRHYRNHEIVGVTVEDFFLNLQDAYAENADTLEKVLAVYTEDIATPTQSRTIRRTRIESETLPKETETRDHEISETTPEITVESTATYGGTTTTTGTGSQEQTTVDYALENRDSTPSQKVTTEDTTSEDVRNGGSDTGTQTTSGGTTTRTESESVSRDGGSRKFDSEETEEWSDVGVAPNYTLLNGFIANNKTMEAIFTKFFESCFTINEALIW